MIDLATVPLDFRENVEWRVEARNLVESDPAALAEVYSLCEADVVYFVNGWGWTYRAKPWPGETLPMILWPIQERMMRGWQRQGGREPAHLDKSRGMGASWCLAFFAFWLCAFLKQTKVLFASWKGDLVDQANNPDTLFGKLDIINDNMPATMRAPWEEKDFRKKNFALWPRTKSLCTGETTTKRMGRAGRNALVVLDEFGHMGQTPRDSFRILEAIRPTTDCYLMASTPFGMGNAFAEQKFACPNRYTLWWPDSPLFNAGLDVAPELKVQGATLASLRPATGFFSDDHENLRGKLTSPWYERECREAPSPQFVAQEIDIDYSGSGWQYFPEALIKRIMVEDVMPPLHIGNLVVDPDTGACRGFSEVEPGTPQAVRSPLSLWINLVEGLPSKGDEFVVGCDVAAGHTAMSDSRGATNSVAVVLNRKTGEVAGEWAMAGIEAPEFAIVVLALCRFFNGAYVIWEANGPGMAMVKIARDFGYQRVFWRRSEKKVGAEVSREPGFWSMPGPKKMVFDQYRDALRKRYVTERSKRAAEELRMYQDAPGTVVHAVAESTTDPTGAKDNHADRVVARVMAYHGLVSDLGYNPVEPVQLQELPNPDAPVGSVAWMRWHGEQRARPRGELVY